MNLREIINKILIDISDNCKVLNADLNLENFEIDSISFIKIIVELETELNIRFGDEILGNKSLHNIEELVKYIEALQLEA